MLGIKDMKFKSKLSLLIGVSVLGFLVFGLVAYLTIDKVKVGGPVYASVATKKDILADYAPPSGSILEGRILVSQMEDADQTALQKLADKFKQKAMEFDKTHERWSAAASAKQKEAIERSYQSGREYFQAAEREFIPLLLRGEKAKAHEVRVKVMRSHAGEHSQAIDEVVKLTQEDVVKTEQDAASVISARTAALFAIGIAVVVIVTILGFLIARGVLKPLAYTMEVLQSLAQGDLTRHLEIDSQDEIGTMAKSLNQAIESMHTTVVSIAGTAEHVASASEEISSSATQQAQGAETQKDQTAQVATAMQEMSSTVLQVSENSNKAADAAKQAADTAKHGGQIVDDTLAKMRVIADSVGGTAKKMEELGKSSDQIGHIIGVIDDIADQTNLLALNAAIEAARAGEQGRGFAVVADEVRKLAERTTTATKEIAQMIKNIQDETKTAVTAMEAGTKQVEEGVKSTAQAGDSLKEIIHMSEQVGEMITHIATAATEQSSATEQVNGNIDQIAKLVKESAVGAQQSAKACQDLSGLALDLQKMVGNFKMGTDGHGSQGSGHRPNGRARQEASSAHREDSPAKAFAAAAH